MKSDKKVNEQICALCKKQYEGYIIILTNNIECFFMDKHIRDIYYEKKKDKYYGLCESCRKELVQDSIWKVQNWFAIELRIKSIIYNIKEKKDKIKVLKEYKEALIRVENIIKKAEEDPVVQAMYRKNNPAAYKNIPKKKTKCIYCNENYGQKWINNPNNDDWQEDLKEDKCWWVCIPCEKIIELQQRDAFLGHFENCIKDKFSKKVKKQRKEIDKEINKIAYEDGQKLHTLEFLKQKGGKYKIKEKVSGYEKDKI